MNLQDCIKKYNIPGLELADNPAKAVQAHIDSLNAEIKDIAKKAEDMGAKVERVKVYDQPAYHGTPHQFDTFTTDAIGSGEGAQAYGWGLYFASNRDVAEWYRKNLSEGTILQDIAIGDLKIYEDEGPANYGPDNYGGEAGATLVEDILLNEWKLKEAFQENGEQGIKDFIEEKIDEKIEYYQEEMDNDPEWAQDNISFLEYLKTEELDNIEVNAYVEEGQLYEVDIPEDGEYLLWDKPLSEQQHILHAIMNKFDFDPYAYGDYETGEDLYNIVAKAKGSEKEASLYLKSLGIRGIKYLDGNSRKDGEGDYNYVIFDENDVEIQQTYYQEINGKDGFNAWSEGGDVLDGYEINDHTFKQDDPIILRVYHGTTNVFNVFDASVKGNKEGQFGSVNYFTSSEYDAQQNYAGEGPDLTNRIEQRAEQIKSEQEIDIDQAREIAKKELHGGEENVMELYVKTKNPFVIGDKQYIELFDMDEIHSEAKEQIADEEGISIEELEERIDEFEDAIYDRQYELQYDTESPVISAIETVANRYDIDPTDVLMKVQEFGEELESGDLEGIMRTSEAFMYAEDNTTGELIGSQLVGEIIQEMGYDSIILKNAEQRFSNMDMETGTTHIHIFDENNTHIKSATNNSGEYSLTNPDIYKQKTKFVTSSKKTNSMGVIDETIAKTIKRQPGEIKLEYGYQNKDGTGRGLEHIKAKHLKEIISSGYKSVQGFVEDVATNFTEIRQAKAGALLLVKHDEDTGKTLIVRLQPDREGDYYTVETAMPMRKNRIESKFKLLGTRSESPAVTPSGQPKSARKKVTKSGPTAPNANNGQVGESENYISNNNIYKNITDNNTSKSVAGYYSPQETLIRLTEASNASTFMHEFAHFMLDMERKTNGKHLKAINEWYAKNTQDIATEAGVKVIDVENYLNNSTTGNQVKNEAIDRALHEQFARAFEAYIMENKAPSSALRKAFRVMANMMIQVYKQLTFNRPNLDDEMRQVFDRLLVVDEAVAAAEARDRYQPLFTDAVMAGMTEKQYQDYLEKSKEPTEKAKETLREKVMKELTRVHERWWKAEKTQYIDEEKDRLKEEPIFLAREQIKSDPDLKLHYDTVKEILDVSKLPRKLYNMTDKEGKHPDEIASVFGFNSGEELLNALVDTPTLNKLAEQNAEAKMKEKYGDIINDGTLDKLADEMVKNDERAELMLKEIKVLSKGRVTPDIDRQALQFYAEEAVGKLSLSELRPAKYRQAEIRSAQEAALALNNGDKEAALKAKTQQLVNFYLWREAMNARELGEKVTKLQVKVNKKSFRERYGKMGGGYLEQLDRLLERFELRKSVSMTQHQQTLAQWVKQKEDEGVAIAVSDEALNEIYSQHWKQTPIATLQGIYDTAQSIMHNARESNVVKMGEEKLEYETAIARMLKVIEKLPDKFQPERDTDVKGFKFYADRLLAAQVKIPWMLSELDGERVGVLHQLIMQPINEAYDNETKLWLEVGEPLMDLINSRSNEDIARHERKYHIPEIATLKTSVDGTLKGTEILSVALNTGNASNLRKLLLGMGWAETEDQVSIDNPKLQAVLSKLNKSDWILVQAIWDRLAILGPKLAKVNKQATGVDMEMVKPMPVKTPYGTFPGGYYPVVYDRNLSDMADKHAEKADEESLSMFNDNGFLSPAVNTGAKTARTGVTGPIRLSLEVIPNHIKEVTHYITHYEAVKQANRLTSDHRIKEAVIRKLGRHHYQLFKPWLNDVAKDGRENAMKEEYDPLWRKLRSGVTYGVMGFKASTGLIQIAGLFNTIAEVGLKNTLSVIPKIYNSNVGGLFGKENQAWEFAKLHSNVMAHRLESNDREIQNAMNRLRGQKGFISTAQELSMKHIAYIQTFMVDLPSWYAAYAKGMNDFNQDEQRAFRYADWVVENVQGSGLTKDMSKIMRSKSELMKLSTMFMTFFSSLYNMNADIKHRVQNGTLNPLEAIWKMMLLWTLPVLFETFMREGFEDDEDDPLLKKIALGTAMMPIQTLPVINAAANGFLSGFGYQASPVYSTIGKAAESFSRAYDSGDMSYYGAKNMAKLAAVMAGIPGTNQAFITGEHLYDVINEGEELTFRNLFITTSKD